MPIDIWALLIYNVYEMGVYVRKERRANERVYYWLVTSYREGNKVKQKKLCYMGTNEPTLEEVKAAKDKTKTKLWKIQDWKSK